ncbi:MAG: hypothetical protein AB9856_13915 [Cellulosilyticaceae bacterium]
MKKRIVTIVSIGILLIFGLVGCTNVETKNSTNKDYTSSQITYKLTPFSPEEKDIKIVNVDTVNDEVYIMNETKIEQQDEIIICTSNGKELAKVSTSNMWHEDLGRDKFELSGDTLWAIGPGKKQNELIITYCDIKQQEWKQLQLDDENKIIETFDISNAGEVFVMYRIGGIEENRQYIARLSPDFKKEIKNINVSEEHYIPCPIKDILIDDTEENIYIISPNQIFKLNLKDGSVLACLSQATKKQILKALIYKDTLIVGLESVSAKINTSPTIELYKMEKEDIQPNQQLSLLTNYYDTNTAFINEINYMKTKYPNLICNVQYPQTEEMYSYTQYVEKLKLKLLAKDKDFNIFCIDPKDLLNMKGEYSEPLGNEAELEIIDSLLPSIQKIIIKDGQVIGGIGQVLIHILALNPAYEQEFRFTQQESMKWEWQDFLAYVDQYAKDNNKDGKIDRWFTDMTAVDLALTIIKDFEVQNADGDIERNIYNDEKVIKLLEGIKKAVGKGTLISGIDATKQDMSASTILQKKILFGIQNANASDGREYRLYPTLNSQKPLYSNIEADIYCINPTSPNKELAKEVILTSMMPEFNISENDQFIYKDASWYSKYYNLYIEKMKQEGVVVEDKRETGKVLPLEGEFFKVLEHAYTYGRLSILIPQQEEKYIEFIKAYLGDKMTLDQFKNQLYQTRRMALKVNSKIPS